MAFSHGGFDQTPSAEVIRIMAFKKKRGGHFFSPTYPEEPP